MPEPPPSVRCEYCGQPRQLVWVHGHGQCAHCGNNIEPCCQGDETLPCPAPEVPANPANPDQPPEDDS